MSKILVVDDDFELLDTVKELLSRNGYVVDTASCVSDAEPMLGATEYDLIIVDWVMPGVHGIDFVDALRKKRIHTPVLMLTGQDSIQHKTSGLDAGADDYLIKPFDRRELVSRVRALLRRPRTVEADELTLSGVSINTHTLRVSWYGTEVKLTKQEYQLLELLMRNKNHVFSHDALVERAWSAMSESSRDTVRVHMSRLRKKFEDGAGPCPLKTVHGQGYVFVADEN